MVNCSSKSKRRKIEKSQECNSSRFLELITYDLLFEILLRLPDCKSAIQYSLVCKQWFEVISSQDFITKFIHFHNQRRRISKSLPYTLMFRTSLHHHTTQPFFSSDSHRLHKTTSPTIYFDFLPLEKVVTLANHQDLVLVADAYSGHLCVCNPVTKQWLEIPSPSHVTLIPIYGLICSPNSCTQLLEHDCNCKNGSKLRPFKAVVIHDHHVLPYYNEKLRVTIFCSETGEWCNTRRLDLRLGIPNREWRCHTKLVVAGNGIMNWLFVCNTGKVKGVASFDPFKEADDPKQSHFVGMPPEFHRGWRAFPRRAHIGMVCGRLRLSQMFKLNGVGYSLRIWELSRELSTKPSNSTSSSSIIFTNTTTNYNNNNNSTCYGGEKKNVTWELVHDVIVPRAKSNNMRVVAFHPGNGDVIFFLRGVCVCGYDVVSEKYNDVGRFLIPEEKNQKKFVKESLDLGFVNGFTIAHPPWPTKLPVIPNI